MNELSALLLLPHIRLQNVNIISSPLAWGFPAMTNFLGAAHRIFRDVDLPVKLASVGLVCHKFNAHTSHGEGSYTHRLHLCRLPVEKDGSAASRIDEGRGNIEISLLLGLTGEVEDENLGKQELASKIHAYLQGMRIAGGSVLPSSRKASWHNLPESRSEQNTFFRRFRYRLLPGFALLERRDILINHLKTMRGTTPDANAMDALLDLCRINWEVARSPEDAEKGIWTRRERNGWLVPITTGFRGLSPLYEGGAVKNARDLETPFRFVENIYTLGEWKSPHRLTSLDELMWHYHVDENKGLYLCAQKQGDFK